MQVLKLTAPLGFTDILFPYLTYPLPQLLFVRSVEAGFMLLFLGCFDLGDHIAVASSTYPCYRNIMKATGLQSVSIPVNQVYKVTCVELAQEIARRKAVNEPMLKGIILSSPSNPTGAMLTADELRGLCQLCDEHNILYLSDEIYHGIR